MPAIRRKNGRCSLNVSFIPFNELFFGKSFEILIFLKRKYKINEANKPNGINLKVPSRPQTSTAATIIRGPTVRAASPPSI